MKSPSITRLSEVDSTNRYALDRIATLDDGQVIVADRQTAGRGRLRRTWSSAEGNLAASIVLKPREVRHVPNLTQYMALTVCETVEGYGAEACLKWPNDVQSAGRKLAGILSEAVFTGARFDGIVVGVGVNLNMDPAQLERIDQPAISLNLLVGTRVDRDSFLEALLARFFQGYPRFLEEGFPGIRGRYLERFPWIGREIVVSAGETRITGKVAGLTEEGALVLEDPGGKRRVVTVGDVVARTAPWREVPACMPSGRGCLRLPDPPPGRDSPLPD